MPFDKCHLPCLRAFDQNVCHVPVYSLYKNFHLRYEPGFNNILLISTLGFSPSAIPQMSDIHIHIHLTALKEGKKAFLMIIKGEYKTARILYVPELFHVCIFKAK